MDHISVAVPPDLLFYIYRENINGTVHYKGLAFDIFNEICRLLNLTYDVVQADGYDKPGTGTGVINLIEAGKADVGVALITATYNRNKKVNFLMPFYSMDTCFAIGLSQESMILRFLKPFQTSLWWAIFGSLITFFLTYLIISWVTGGRDALGYILACLKLAIRQSVSSYVYKSIAGKIVMASLLMGSFVIIASYTANLVAISAVVIEKKIDTFLKLSANPKYKLMFHKGSAYQDVFLSSKNPVLARVRKNQITGLEEHLLPYDNIDYSNVARQILDDNLAFVTGYDEVLQTASKNCRVTVAKERWRDFTKTFAVSKGFRYEEQFNLIITRLLVSGVVNRWTHNHRKSFFKPDDMTCSERQDFVTFADVSVHFMWMGIGATIATVVFIVEIVLSTCNRREKV